MEIIRALTMLLCKKLYMNFPKMTTYYKAKHLCPIFCRQLSLPLRETQIALQSEKPQADSLISFRIPFKKQWELLNHGSVISFFPFLPDYSEIVLTFTISDAILVFYFLQI